jgi:uncharacterized membrane protein HdeD (DUF308 family)
MVVFFGALLLVAGITEVIQEVMVRNWGFALHPLAAGLYLVTGLFMLEDRERAAAVLALLIAAIFVGGLLRTIYSLVERFHGWSWMVLWLAVRVHAVGTDRLAMLDV